MKHTMRHQKLAGALMALLMLLGGLAPLTVDARTYYGHNHYYYHHRYGGYGYYPTYFQRHPYQKSGLVGAGVGAAAGALLGPEGDRTGTAVKGAVLGGAVGLGYQFLKRRGTFD